MFINKELNINNFTKLEHYPCPDWAFLFELLASGPVLQPVCQQQVPLGHLRNDLLLMKSRTFKCCHKVNKYNVLEILFFSYIPKTVKCAKPCLGSDTWI